MQTLVLNIAEAGAVEHAAELLYAHKLVAFPTDTVYGLGALAFEPDDIAALYEAKQRPPEKAIAVLIADPYMVDQVAENYSDVARRLMERFWPGPMTLIVPKRSDVPSILSNGSTIGVRVPELEAVRKLLKRTGPLAVTSANRSGASSPRTAREVLEQLEGRIHLVLDGGETPGLPSTVLDCAQLPPTIVRAGPITEEQVRAVVRLA
jgi:L-threonylcarbamoyladenylate synthase